MYHGIFNPEVSRQEQHQGAFLTSRRQREVRVHISTGLLVNPLKRGVESTARLLACMHHGKVTGYAAYVLVITGNCAHRSDDLPALILRRAARSGTSSLAGSCLTAFAGHCNPTL